MNKSVNVSVDLFGEGIIDLPITYSIGTDEAKPDAIALNCSIDCSAANSPGWLYGKHFKFLFSRTSNNDAVIININRKAGKKNVYYELMLNVVFEYIWLREFSNENHNSYAIV